MILTFSKTEFRTLIKKGIKVHTIRNYKNNRCKVGNKIHFWLGNPRNTRGKNKPYQFGIGKVSKVETIIMHFACAEDWQDDIVYIGDCIKIKTSEELNSLAVNDGFENWQQMKSWFGNDSGQYFGKIIFWENFELTGNDDGINVY